MKLILLFLLSGGPVLAEDCINCTVRPEPFINLEKNIEDLEAPTTVNCTDVLKLRAKEEYLSFYGGAPKQKSKILGFTLEGSADELKFLSKMLKDKPMDTWKQAADCKTVLCALTRTYNSEESAYRVLNIAKRDGYIVSAAKDYNIEGKNTGQLFSLPELQKIDLAYKALPKQFKNLKSLDRLSRLPNGYSSTKAPNAVAYATKGYHSKYYDRDGEIVFLESGLNSDGSWGPLVAVHELSHHVDYSKSDVVALGISEEKEFMALSGWKKTTAYETDEATGKKKAVEKWQHEEGKKFITDYAGTQPAEDFAESVAHYMYYPHQFKAVDPVKYGFIKNNVFMGKEFLNEPRLNISKEEVFKICLENQKVLSLYGNVSYSETTLDKRCLDKYFENFKYHDPELCLLNPDQIKNYLGGHIRPMMDNANQTLAVCNKSIEEHRKSCQLSGDFRKSCSLDKCQLPPGLKNKVKDATMSFYGKDQTVNIIIQKMGKENFLTTALKEGLSEKQKISENYNLTVQKYFLDNAVKGLVESYEKAGLKFDSAEEAQTSTQRHLMLDPSVNADLKSFQQNVLLKATRNKEKNYNLIKTWAASINMKVTPEMEDLAELLKKYGSFF